MTDCGKPAQSDVSAFPEQLVCSKTIELPPRTNRRMSSDSLPPVMEDQDSESQADLEHQNIISPSASGSGADQRLATHKQQWEDMCVECLELVQKLLAKKRQLIDDNVELEFFRSGIMPDFTSEILDTYRRLTAEARGEEQQEKYDTRQIFSEMGGGKDVLSGKCCLCFNFKEERFVAAHYAGYHGILDLLEMGIPLSNINTLNSWQDESLIYLLAISNCFQFQILCRIL